MHLHYDNPLGRLTDIKRVVNIYNPYKQVYLVRTEGDHFLHFTRTPDGTLTDISATGGTRVHLHYDNPLGRLTDIKRVVNNEAVETLITT